VTNSAMIQISFSTLLQHFNLKTVFRGDRKLCDGVNLPSLNPEE